MSVLVTGAAQGIGKAIADAFEANGLQVARVDRQPGGYEFDVSDTAAIPALLDRVEADLGAIDVLVNAAGICPTRPFFEVDEPTFRHVLEINVVGPFFLLQAVAGRMADRRRGSIVNIASVSGFIPKLEQLDYGASKAALVSITRSAAASLGRFGVRVNAIAPGVIDTPLTQAIAKQRAAIRGIAPAATLEPVLSALPLGRIGTPEEVASLAVFLASDAASYITGQTIDVCGGQLMR